VTAVTQCPSKQNIAFYKAHFITNRDLIDSIHTNTVGFGRSLNPDDLTTNSQTLANLLIVFEEHDFKTDLASETIIRTAESEHWKKTGQESEIWKRDREMAVGIAAGYVNLTASLLGYNTGCCACFDQEAIKTILGLEMNPILLMGVGYSDPTIHRRIHHKETNFMFPSKPKQTIKIKHYN
jgi:nitroreductase